MDSSRHLRVRTALAAVAGTMALVVAACGTTEIEQSTDSGATPPLPMIDSEDSDPAGSADPSSSSTDDVPSEIDGGSSDFNDSPSDLNDAADEAGAGSSTGGTDTVETEPATDSFTERADDWEVTVLGPAMVGDGDFVQLIERAAGDGGSAAEDEEPECVTGWLGLQRPDGAIHRYDHLGHLGHLRLFNGPRGQDALVASCEESVERVLIQGSAVVPPDGVPQFIEFPLGEPHHMSFFADFAWRGDLFGGYAWSDGWDELVYFDTGSQLITDASVLLGTREDGLDRGFDFVLPDGWELEATDPELGLVSMVQTDGLAWMIIEPVEFAGDPEFPEGIEPLGFWTEQVPLWEYVSPGRASRAGVQDRPTWVLNTGDGTRTVMHLEGGEIDLIVDFYIADTETWMLPVAQAAAEQIRVYRQPILAEDGSDLDSPVG